jgi:hypothetical protein
MKRINRALQYPDLAFQSAKDIRDMMMTKFWQKHSFDEVTMEAVDPKFNGA